MNYGDLPINFCLALSQNEAAIKQFEKLNDSQKQSVINKTRKINTKQEMRCFVDSISEGSIVL